MSQQFMFSTSELKILGNFGSINQSIVINPDKIEVINVGSSVIAKYPYDTPYNFDSFGIYEISDFLGILNVLNKPNIEVKDSYLNIIGSNNDKVRYFTTAKELIPKVPSIEEKFNKMNCELQFALPADKLAYIMKMASILKSKFIFFETENDRIRITVGDDLDSSANNYELYVEDGITNNVLDKPVKISIEDFKILAGEYEIKISKKISRWTNLNNVVYYIFTSVV